MTIRSKILIACCLVLILLIAEYHLVCYTLPKQTVTITITETVTITKVPFKVKYFRPFSSKLTLEIIDNYSKLGELVSWFNITRCSRDEVNTTLTFTFYGANNVKNIGLHVQFSLIPFDGAYPPFLIAAPPILTFFLSNGERITLFSETYNMSKYIIPGFYISYSIQSIQLTFENNRTVVCTHFFNGTYDLYEEVTLSHIHMFTGGIHPLWESKYKYPPSTVSMEFLQLSGVHVNVKVTLDLSTVKYTVSSETMIIRP